MHHLQKAKKAGKTQTLICTAGGVLVPEALAVTSLKHPKPLPL